MEQCRSPNRISKKKIVQHLKIWFFFKNTPIHFHINNTKVIRQVKRNVLSFSRTEIKKPIPAPNLVSDTSDTSSEAKSSYCHKSNVWSYLQWRVEKSTEIATLQITSSGRSSIYTGKGGRPRMKHWGTPALTGYSCEDFPPSTTRSNLLQRKY